MRLVKSPKMEELDVLDALLTEKITNKEPPKVALSRVKFTQFLVQQYGIRSGTVRATEIFNKKSHGGSVVWRTVSVVTSSTRVRSETVNIK